MVELSPYGVTKGSGLAEVARRSESPPPADGVAFGECQRRVDAALGRAGRRDGERPPDALAAADEVTLSNADDGVAVVLERWF